MSVTNTIPTIWAGALLRAFDKSFVYAARTNSNYTGEISKKGDQVKIVEVGDISVNEYTRDSSISYDTVEDASQFLTIEKEQYIAFRIDDADEFQADPERMQEAIRKGGVSVKDEVDQYIAALYSYAGVTSSLGTDDTPLDINSDNVYSTLLLINEALDNNNVPQEGRWAVVPPWFKKKLLLADVSLNTNNSGSLRTGEIGRYGGFDIFVSNNVQNTASAKYKIMAGTNDAITFAQQIQKTEVIRLQDYFADGFRGLYLYGAKVVHPEALACATCDEASET